MHIATVCSRMLRVSLKEVSVFDEQ